MTGTSCSSCTADLPDRNVFTVYCRQSGSTGQTYAHDGQAEARRTNLDRCLHRTPCFCAALAHGDARTRLASWSRCPLVASVARLTYDQDPAATQDWHKRLRWPPVHDGLVRRRTSLQQTRAENPGGCCRPGVIVLSTCALLLER